MPLADAVAVPFERVVPVRTFPAYKGQRNFPGFYYAACLDAHVEFESWLERAEAMALDFDATVAAFAAQPFWLSWPDTGEAAVDHPAARLPPVLGHRTVQGAAVGRWKVSKNIERARQDRESSDRGGTFALVNAHRSS